MVFNLKNDSVEKTIFKNSEYNLGPWLSFLNNS